MPVNSFRNLALWGFVLALLGLVGLRYTLDYHGMHGVHVSYAGAQDVRAHFWHDALDPSVSPIEWSAFLWQDEQGVKDLAVRSNGQVQVIVNDEPIWASEAQGGSTFQSFQAPMQAGANSVILRYDGLPNFDDKTQIGLYEKQGLGIWLPINPYQLYVSEPTREEHVRSSHYLLLARLSFVSVLVGIGLLMAKAVRRIVPRRELFALVVLALFAVIIRLVVLDQREAADPAFYNMDAVYDNYVMFSRRMLVGDFPLAGSPFQQGNIAYLGALQFMFSPSIVFLQIWNSMFGVLAVVFIFLATRYAFGRAGGYTAGFIAAAYAPMLFYQQSLNIAALAIWLLSAAALALVWFYKRGDLLSAVIFGCLVGLSTMTRSTAVFVLSAGMLAAGLLPLPRQKRLVLMCIMVASTVLIMLPLYVANLQAGLNSPTSSAGSLVFYLNNNRHADGLNGPETDAVLLARLRGENFRKEFLEDLENYPLRWPELLVRKAGLLFSKAEHADDGMLDFQTRGVQASPLLKALYLWGLGTHQFLMGIILWGSGLLIWSSSRHRRLTVLLALVPIGYGAGLLPFFVAARGRIPLVAPAIVLTGTLAIGVRKSGALRAAVFLPIVVLFLMGTNWIADNLPRPTTVRSLPADVQETPATFNDQIRLLGYSDFDTANRAGQYVDLTLYWQSLAPIDHDLTVFLHLLDRDFQQVGGRDVPIGEVGFPKFYTSNWDVGTIFKESYFFKLPDDVQTYEELTLVVGIYADQEPWQITDTRLPTIGNSVRLFAIAALPEAAPAPDHWLADFANELRLVRAEFPAAAEAGSAIAFDFEWYSLQRPPTPYHMFLHLMAGDELLTGHDEQLSAELATDAWAADRRYDNRITLMLPSDLAAGCYQVYVGLYELGAPVRVPVTTPEGTQDNRLSLGEVCVGDT